MEIKFPKYFRVEIDEDYNFTLIILYPAAELDSPPLPVRRGRPSAARQLPGAVVVAQASWFAVPADWAAAKRKRKPWDRWFIHKG